MTERIAEIIAELLSDQIGKEVAYEKIPPGVGAPNGTRD